MFTIKQRFSLSLFILLLAKNSISLIIEDVNEDPYLQTYFDNSTSICGNGIVEEGEECDCGSLYSCTLHDPCCHPMGSGELGCTLKEHSECSQVEECCTSCCKFESALLNKRCGKTPNNECYQTSTCNGRSGICPEATPKRDRTPCNKGMFTCKGGLCNSTVCLDNYLLNCECTEERFNCQLCCKEEQGGRCLPASYFGIYDYLHGLLLVKNIGYPCNDFKGYCNEESNCISKDVQKQEEEDKSYKLHGYLSYALNVFLFFMLVIVLALVYHFKFRKPNNLYYQRRFLQNYVPNARYDDGAGGPHLSDDIRIVDL